MLLSNEALIDLADWLVPERKLPPHARAIARAFGVFQKSGGSFEVGQG